MHVQITKQYQCARLTGLDSCDGLMLLGSTHFYVIEGITTTRTGEVIDIESAATGYVCMCVHHSLRVCSRHRYYSTVSGLIRLVISLECFIEITPDFLCPFMND